MNIHLHFTVATSRTAHGRPIRIISGESHSTGRDRSVSEMGPKIPKCRPAAQIIASDTSRFRAQCT